MIIWTPTRLRDSWSTSTRTPCLVHERELLSRSDTAQRSLGTSAGVRNRSFGVTIHAQYTVGEYDIVILSVEQSGGLEAWLRENGYRIPSGASTVLGSYIRQGMRFFVARVNLEEQSRLGFSYLRSIQIAYESPKFMLPIRLGMVNADGPQDLFVFALTRKGRIETTNYRTVRLPTSMELPVFLKDQVEFANFYRDMFAAQVERENMRTVFLEYAWDMSWCDPCAADPLSNDELRELGVFWLGGLSNAGRSSLQRAPDVFLTRLHMRYDAEHFPDDLVFQETADRNNFQSRYVLRHAWNGEDTCAVAQQYRATLLERREQEAQTLASLTGWDITTIRRKMNIEDPGRVLEKQPWWHRIWGE